MVGEPDVRPVAMPVAQAQGASLPFARHGNREAVRPGIGPGAHMDQAVGDLGLAIHEILRAVRAEQGGQFGIARVVHQPGPPAERGRRVSDGGNRVAAVVLAVAEGAHAVFPCLAPVDRAQPEQHPGRAGRPVQRRAPLQAVFQAQVVMHAGIQAGQRGRQQIALGRMQVAAGGIAAQRPARGTVLLPGGQAERQFEQRPDAVAVERHRRRQPPSAQVAEARVQPVGDQRQRGARRTFEAAEGIGLRRPVQMPGPWRIGAQPVLAFLVVVENAHLRLRDA